MLKLFLLGLAGLIRLLPAGLRVLVGRFIGWSLRCVFRFRIRIVRMQLALAFPEWDESQLEKTVRGLYRHLGLSLVEILSLPGVNPEFIQNIINYEGEQNLKDGLARGKGVLLLTCHIGNWELPGISLVADGYNIRAIGKEMKNAAGDTLREMLRDGNGVVTIPRRNSIKQILRELKQNNVVTVVLDQNMTADEGIFVDFFGYPACTMKALAVLAARTGAAVIPCQMWREPNCRDHWIKFHPAVPCEELPDADVEENHRHNTQRYTKVLEAMIRSRPEQWLWIHKRWRTRPAGETESPFPY